MNESAGKWTPELKMQAFKEIVTAIMGLAVVIFTLVLAWSSLTYSANDAQMSNVKDILLLVLGLSGVVIGYYFGRIPADARTTLANAKAEKAAVQASAAADGLDNVIAKATGGAAARGAGGDQAAEENAAAIEELRRVRDNLRSVANS